MGTKIQQLFSYHSKVENTLGWGDIPKMEEKLLGEKNPICPLAQGTFNFPPLLTEVWILLFLLSK